MSKAHRLVAAEAKRLGLVVVKGRRHWHVRDTETGHLVTVVPYGTTKDRGRTLANHHALMRRYEKERRTAA